MHKCDYIEYILKLHIIIFTHGTAYKEQNWKSHTNAKTKPINVYYIMHVIVIACGGHNVKWKKRKEERNIENWDWKTNREPEKDRQTEQLTDETCSVIKVLFVRMPICLCVCTHACVYVCGYVCMCIKASVFFNGSKGFRL